MKLEIARTGQSNVVLRAAVRDVSQAAKTSATAAPAVQGASAFLVFVDEGDEPGEVSLQLRSLLAALPQHRDHGQPGEAALRHQLHHPDAARPRTAAPHD